MSRHQAYRNYDYENDLDEYAGGEGYSDEEEELSPEDQAQMKAAMTEVRGALGDEAGKVTIQQIQESLWHYYYDVDKTVAYLVSKYITPAPKAGEMQAAKKNRTEGSQHPQPIPLADIFADMPWLHIPKDREATFIEPLHPRGGLLGGTSKMSKLQQLAAARKKKTEGQKYEEKSKDDQKTTREADQLFNQAEKVKENITPGKSTAFSNVAEKPASYSSGDSAAMSGQKRRQSGSDHMDGRRLKSPKETIPSTKEFHWQTDELVEQIAEPFEQTDEPVAPSKFAQTLLGSASPPTNLVPRKTYALPYMAFMQPAANPFADPSPDDVVQNAQSQASNKKLASTTKKKVGTDDKVDKAADDVKALKIDDTPLPKSKNLNVVSEYQKSQKKKTASFVVVGHVDAGKSTLMGRLLLDMGAVDQRTFAKYRKEAENMGMSSFALAWILDQGTEERSRGVTVDIATNTFETDTTSFTILDAPGHRDFIPNMIAGASQADFAILVVEATTGAFEAGLKGQTREHSLLIRSMGVSRVIVAVNKLDTVGWSQERFDEISNQVTGFLVSTGFQMKNVSFVPVSGLHGGNLVHKATDPAASWYTGDTLTRELEKSEPLIRAMDKPLRITISDVFRTTQSPLTISGRIDAGSLQAGDALLIQPSGEKAYVKSLEVDSEPADWAVAGQNAVLHLSNIAPIHVRVGDIVCDPKSPAPCTDTFTVKALAFDILTPGKIDVHRGRLHAAGQIMEIPVLLDKVKGTVIKKRPAIVKPGTVARVVVKLGSQVPLEVGQRVVLRSNGETVAAGLLE